VVNRRHSLSVACLRLKRIQLHLPPVRTYRPGIRWTPTCGRLSDGCTIPLRHLTRGLSQSSVMYEWRELDIAGSVASARSVISRGTIRLR
jgi:hypothetical protein